MGGHRDAGYRDAGYRDAGQRRMRRQRHHRGERVARRHMLDAGGVGPGQAVQRQPQADRAVAGQQEQRVVAEMPARALPRPPRPIGHPAQRQHAADRRTQPLGEQPRHAGALQRIAQPAVLSQHVGRQPMLLPHIVQRVLVGRLHHGGIDAKAPSQGGGEAGGVGLGGGAPVGIGARVGTSIRVGQQRLVLPDRLAIMAPMRRQRPARQRLAGVLLAHAVVQHRAGRPQPGQPPDQPPGIAALGGAERIGVPLAGLEIGGRHEGRLAAQGQPHVARRQRRIHLGAGRQDLAPLRVAVGPGDARRLQHPAHRHLEAEFHPRCLHRAADRGGGLRIGAGGQRDMALAGHQAGGGVQPDPAGTGQVDLRPGMQVGEIGLRPGRAVQRLHVGHQLDQVAGDEARRVAQVAQQLHQQPGGVAARALARAERLLGRPDARLHAYDIGSSRLHQPVQRHQLVHVALFGARHLGQQRGQKRPHRVGAAIRRQLVDQHRVVLERPGLGLRLQEEVERIDGGHVGHKVNGHREPRDLLREHHPGQEIALRVLLPVKEMRLRLDRERIGQHRGAGMRRRAQADGLRAERHRPVVAVFRPVRQRHMDRHA